MWNNEVWGTRKPVELSHTSPKRLVLPHFYGSKERFCTPFMKQIAEIDWLACIACISLGLGSNDQQWDFLCFACAKNGARAKKMKEREGGKLTEQRYLHESQWPMQALKLQFQN